MPLFNRLRICNRILLAPQDTTAALVRVVAALTMVLGLNRAGRPFTWLNKGGDIERFRQPSIASSLFACRYAFAAVAAFSVCINLLMLTVPLYLLQIFDRVLGSRSEETLLMLTIAAVGALAVLAALEAVRSLVFVRLAARLDSELSGHLLSADIAANVCGFRDDAQGLFDLTKLRGFITSPNVFVFFDAPLVPLYIAVIFLIHPTLGSIALGGAFMLVGLAVVNELATRRPLAEANACARVALNRAQRNLRNAETIEAMGMGRTLLMYWQRDHAAALRAQAQAGDRSSYLSATSKFFRFALQVLLLCAGAYLAIHREITGGMMIAASIIMGRGLVPLDTAIGTWRSFVDARMAYRRINQALASVSGGKVSMSLPKPQGRLLLRNAGYIPPGAARPVLQGISFELGRGEVLGIVGPTAAGKSTLLRLIMGVLPATFGEVRLDGADVSNWDRAELGRHLGYLPQTVELFARTVVENIARMDRPDPEAVVAAAKMAGVHEIILTLPDGYATQVEDYGFILSGGQRQRIALARALYGEPRLLVLDEPNAHVDGPGEAALLETIAAAKAKKITTVIVTHRPSILNRVDKMLLLMHGTMEAFGTRDAVMARAVRVADPARVVALRHPSKRGLRPAD